MTAAPRDYDLQVARWLSGHVPLVVGAIDSNGMPVGWTGWQRSRVDPTVMDRWRPGLAVGVVCGHRFDGLDVDPRHGGDESVKAMRELGLMPRVFGWNSTPQGGAHYLIAKLGVGSRDGILPGVDLKGGKPDGSGRGILFLPPTQRKGGRYAYRQLIDFDALAEGDESAEALADYVRSLRPDEGWTAENQAPRYIGPPPIGREAKYLAAVLRNLTEQVRTTPEGRRNATLFVAAMKCGSFAAGAGLGEQHSRTAITDAAKAAGLGAAETERTWASGFTIGQSHPRAVPPAQDGGEQTNYGSGRGTTPAERTVRLTPASLIKPLPVRWLWDQRIPVGEITVTPGRGGVGKSTFHAWVIANLTRGRLPGLHSGRQRPCIIAAREDSWERTIVPRLLAAGADMSLVYRADVITSVGAAVNLTLPADCDGLATEVARVKAVLVSVDPLISTVDGHLDTHKDREVREALEPLAQLANRTGCVLLGNAHFSKSQSRDPLSLIMGSVAFSNVPRAALGFAEDGQDHEHVITQVKNNLGRLDLPSLRYGIEPVVIDTAEGPTEVGRLVMRGESDRSVHDILREHGDDDERSERDEAVEWLTAHLIDHGGQAPAADVIKAAAHDGIARTTLTRARQRAGVTSAKQGMRGGWVWNLVVPVPEESTNGPKNPGDRTLGSSGSSVNSSRPPGDRRPCSICGSADGVVIKGDETRCKDHYPPDWFGNNDGGRH